MRTLFTGMFAAAGLLAIASPALAQNQKVAYLDSRRILAEAPGAEDVRGKIQQEMSRYQSQLKVLSDSVDRMFTEFQQKSVVLSPAEKTKREQEIRQKNAELEQRAAQLQQQAAMKQDSLMGPVMERVEKVISELRKEEGYAIIFDVASNAMVSADTTLDLTSKVIARLKASAPAPTASRNQ